MTVSRNTVKDYVTPAQAGLNSIGLNLVATSLWLTLRAITKNRDVQN
jgi:hypothetical protein